VAPDPLSVVVVRSLFVATTFVTRLALLAVLAQSAAGQAPPPPPFPEEPPPKYDIPADPEALKEAAAEKAAAEAAGETEQVEVVQARMVGDPSSPAILQVERLGQGARPEISRQGDRLAFDRPGDGDVRTGFRAIYTSRFDGTYERCLTCSLPEFADHHVMAPTWHPRGNLLVAVAQDNAKRLGHDERELAGPARALHAELWGIAADGSGAWQITRSASQGRAVGDPSFSHEGGKLAWSERVASEPAPWGEWVVRVGELKLSAGVPRLGKVDTFEPSPFRRFVQVAGFTPDDQGLILLVDREDGRTALGKLDFATKKFELLSREDENVSAASELPRGQWSLWATRGEVWLVSPSGRGRERLTTFGEPSSRYFLGQAEIEELAPGPDGKTLVIDLFESRPGSPPKQSLFLVRFDPDRLGRAR
jgi:hypothetical protein